MAGSSTASLQAQRFAFSKEPKGFGKAPASGVLTFGGLNPRNVSPPMGRGKRLEVAACGRMPPQSFLDVRWKRRGHRETWRRRTITAIGRRPTDAAGFQPPTCLEFRVPLAACPRPSAVRSARRELQSVTAIVEPLDE